MYKLLFVFLVLSGLFGCGEFEEANIDSTSQAVIPGMAAIPAGHFFMGCHSNDPGCPADEQPLHLVQLSAYNIDLLEVTQAQYNQCFVAGRCRQPADSSLFFPGTMANMPVVGVARSQANTYCAWVSKRLPTEAEWEYAARGVTGNLYPWGNTPPDCTTAYLQNCTGSTLGNVGGRPAGASPFGVQDMAGNAAEWVSDFYDPSYYSSSPATDPQGPSTSTGQRVRRGGSYASTGASARELQTSDRNPISEFGADNRTGFRCAISGVF